MRESLRTNEPPSHGISYKYSDNGNHIQQGALNDILDLQLGIAQVIGATTATGMYIRRVEFMS